MVIQHEYSGRIAWLMQCRNINRVVQASGWTAAPQSSLATWSHWIFWAGYADMREMKYNTVGCTGSYRPTFWLNFNSPDLTLSLTCLLCPLFVVLSLWILLYFVYRLTYRLPFIIGTAGIIAIAIKWIWPKIGGVCSTHGGIDEWMLADRLKLNKKAPRYWNKTYWNWTRRLSVILIKHTETEQEGSPLLE
jgi:hypothetical protein